MERVNTEVLTPSTQTYRQVSDETHTYKKTNKQKKIQWLYDALGYFDGIVLGHLFPQSAGSVQINSKLF